MRKIGLSALLMLLLAVPVLPAAAQGLAPEYVESEPADGATMHQAPAEVVVRFSEPLDESSTMEIRDECGGRIDDGNVVVDLQEMSVGIAEEPSGTYKVNYYAKGIRGLTGQTSGSFSFQVHAGSSCDGDGGGHEGHGGNGGNGGKGTGGHEGHGGEGGGGNGGGHEGHESGGDGTDHSTMDHTTTTDHSTMDHSGTSNGKMDHADHKDMKDKHANHGKSKPPSKPGRQKPPPQAGPEDLGGNVEGSAVMISLGLSMVLGVAGGWYLRTSAPR